MSVVECVERSLVLLCSVGYLSHIGLSQKQPAYLLKEKRPEIPRNIPVESMHGACHKPSRLLPGTDRLVAVGYFLG